MKPVRCAGLDDNDSAAIHLILLRKQTMFKHIAAAAVAATLLFSAAGCSTLGDARAAQGTGQVRVYNASFDQVWNAVPAALKDLGLKEEGYSKGSGYVVARGATPVKGVAASANLADKVAIFVDKADSAGKTRVEVVSKGALLVNPLGSPWESRVLDKLSETLPR